MFARRTWAVERPLAFAAVEARHVAARQRHPDHAFAVDVHAARAVTGRGNLVDLRKRRGRGVGAGAHADDRAREGEHRAPDRAVHRIDADAVERSNDALILRRIDRLVRLGIAFVALAVAVGVEDERRPALRLHLVAGFVEGLAVEPADHAALRAAGAGPERVVGVFREHEMVGGEAGADERDLAAFWIVHGEMARGLLDWCELRRGMVRALAAEVRIGELADARGEADPAGLIHHRIVHAGLAVPDHLVAPIGRWAVWIVLRRRRLWITHRHFYRSRGVGLRIEHGEEVCALFGRAVELAVGVDRRLALVGRDLVVQVGLGA